MTAFSRHAIVVIVVLLVAPTLAQQFFFDPERLFMLGDADLDGRLSLDEYRDFLRSSPRKLDAAAIESMFRRFDVDSDGFLSLAEYRKTFPPRRGGTPARPGTAKQPAAGAGTFEDAPTPEQEQFFEAKIRPVLATHCGKCHSDTAEKLKGGLRLDTREGIRNGGDTGSVIAPGQPDESLLIRAIRYGDDDLKMPPKGKLADEVIADFEAWVKMGAPDPRTGPAGSAARPPVDLLKAREFWSFRPPKKSAPPPVNRTNWARGNIDRFLLAAIEARRLAPVADGSRPRLLRRVTFDLIGLPPTPDELDTFVADDSPEALAKVVDRLLVSPRFGERSARRWLDVARYAESSGKTNFTYPQAWRYRDWTIASFNADKPYHQFVREQIAGDLLPADDDRQRADQLIATGFLALGSKAHDAENRGQFALDVIDEQIEATTRAFLGLTVACARCHDHKLDPITQRDYYALSGIFRSTQTCSGTLAGVFPNFNASPLVELPAGASLPSAVPALTARAEGHDGGAPRRNDPRARCDSTRRGEPRPDAADHVHARDAPPAAAHRSYRQFAADIRHGSSRTRRGRQQPPLHSRRARPAGSNRPPRAHPSAERRSSSIDCSGERPRELADWLASPSNPLTARVIVNRVWLHLFGRGLVATPDNFGAAGARPSHPELLDNLAVDFMNDGWSIKRLIRRIVLSRAYGLDSAYHQQNFEADPDNALVWRMSKRRLDAEVVRDALLFVGGRLETTPPVGSAVARMGEGLAFFVRVDGLDAVDTHRSVYLPVVRDQVPEVLALFDFADPSLVTGERTTTIGPGQALYFMNGPLVIRQAEALAERVLTIEGDDVRRVDAAYRLALARGPTVAEQDRAVTFLREFAARRGGTSPERGAWTAFCQALLASAEFRYLD